MRIIRYDIQMLLVAAVFGVSCSINPTDPVGDKAVPLDDSLAELASRHGKYFGTAVVHDVLFDRLEPAQPALSVRYAEIVAGQFHLIVPESEMKMASMWTGDWEIDFSKVDNIADWALERGLKMRGHVLVWHRSLPDWLVEGYQAGTYTKAGVATRVAWYISEVMRHYQTKYPGLIVAWDVVNEAVGPNDPTVASVYGLRPAGDNYADAGEDFWRLTLGDDYVEKAFRWARAADPEAKLYYNDYHNAYTNAKGEAIYALVTGLKAAGVPIDGVGLQCHFDVDYLDASFPGITFSLANISQTIDRWTSAGLDVQITELDIGHSSGASARQAEFFAGLLAVCLQKEGVSAIVTWGFTDRVSWRADRRPLYFDDELNPKPAYFSMLEVLKAIPARGERTAETAEWPRGLDAF